MITVHAGKHYNALIDSEAATGTGTDMAGQDHSHTLADIKVTIATIHTEVIPNYITDATTEAPHDSFIPALIIIALTHHTGDLTYKFIDSFQRLQQIQITCII